MIKKKQEKLPNYGADSIKVLKGLEAQSRDIFELDKVTPLNYQIPEG